MAFAAAAGAGIIAAGGGIAYATGGTVEGISSSLRRLTGRGKKGARRVQVDDEGYEQPVISDLAPVVRCFSQARSRCGELRRLALFKDELLLGSQPGPPEESIGLAGTEITRHGAVLLVKPSGEEDALTLWLEDAEEAEYWADLLACVATASAPEGMQQTLSLGDGELISSSKIQELENRVSTALRAAYERAARIKELEDTVEEGKDREKRILQLEEVLHETLEEAETRAERIEELEWRLEQGGAADPAAANMLQDAMAFADQLLAEDLLTEDGSAQELREAVHAVQQAKPKVDAEVAGLIQKLVTALRWPLVLRERLADAEQTVKEQEEIQEQALYEIIEFQKKCDELASEKEEAARQRQLTDSSHADELRKLEESKEAAEKKREEAEGKAKEFKELLEFADKAAEEAVARERSALEKSHAEEMGKLRHLSDIAEAQQKEAKENANSLQRQLQAAMEAQSAAQQQLSDGDDKLKQELQELRRNREIVDAKRSEAEKQREELRSMLAAAQGKTDEAVADAKSTLEAKHAQEVQRLDRQLQSEQVKRELAESQAKELKDGLVADARAADEASAQQQTKLQDAQEMHRERSSEVENLQEQVRAAEAKVGRVEHTARELRERLAAAEASMDEEAQRRFQVLQAEHAKSLGQEAPSMQQSPSAEKLPKHDGLEQAASRWQETASMAAGRLAKTEPEFKAPSDFADKTKELEARLQNAEKALQDLDNPTKKSTSKKKKGTVNGFA